MNQNAFKRLAAVATAMGLFVWVLMTASGFEMSRPASFVMYLGALLTLQYFWDYVYLKEADTYEQIVVRGNIAYAIERLVPVAIGLVAALAS